MESPQYVLEPGTVIQTHDELDDTKGMIISEKNLRQRRAGAVGVIGHFVAGHGGDVYWVYHGPNQPAAAYSFTEFELSQVRVKWKTTFNGGVREFASLKDAWEVRKADGPGVEISGPFIILNGRSVHRRYVGSCVPGKARIVVKDESDGSSMPLPPRNDLYNHSPDGFSWGYSGSGPAQTALAILADHLREPEHQIPVLMALGFGPREAMSDEDINALVPDGMELHEYLAIRFHQTFKAKVIARLPQEDGWELTSASIDQTISSWLPSADA